MGIKERKDLEAFYMSNGTGQGTSRDDYVTPLDVDFFNQDRITRGQWFFAAAED